MGIIHSKAMIAKLSMTQWSASKTDMKISKEVEQTHGAHNAGRYTKLLVSKSLLEPINKISSAIRTAHIDFTQPWGDDGDRLLPSKLFKQYSDKQRQLKKERELAVQNMAIHYPHEVAQAQQRLGSMYDPNDYPPVAELLKKYSVTIDITQVPAAQDFRVDVADEEAVEIRKQINENVHQKQANAVKATYDRIRDVAEKMYNRLSDPEQTFKDTLVTNISDLCAVLDGLNITEDPQITQMHNELVALIIPPSRLRTDMDVRKKTAAKAKKIIESIPKA